jgi:3-isopropylmalate dehydrogenase
VIANTIEEAVVTVLAAGYRTYDVMDEGTTLVSCSEMGDRIAAAVSAWPAV